MVLWNDERVNVFVYDIETFAAMFYALFYNPDTKEFTEFEYSSERDNFLDLIKFLDDYKDSYFVSYNGLRFDSPILTEIKNKGASWKKENILSNIRILSDRIIEGQNAGKFSLYPETSLFAQQLDLMKILHYDNKNRSDDGAGLVSLKRIEFEMDSENIEENPIDFRKPVLSSKELQEARDYCKNDVLRTNELFFNVIGETEHPLYKGNNQIELRYNIMQEFQIPCLNYSDSKIGDEIVKKLYCEESGINYSDLPKKGTFRRVISIKNCVPSFIKFKTPELQEYLAKLKRQTIKANDEFHYKIDFKGQIYDLKKGGLHNRIENKVYESDENYQLVDIDVASYYGIDTLLINMASKHIKKQPFLNAYSKIYVKRVKLKPLAKKNKKIKGIVEGLKGGIVSVFGKSGDMDSWLFDKELMYSITIGGELMIMMLIESMELAGFPCFMANTDGASFMVKRDRIEQFREIQKNFSAYMDNILKNLGYPPEINFVLEEFLFKKMIFANINNYLAIYEDGTYKFKGNNFKADFKFHENKSARVVNLAVNQYFINKTLPEDYIKNYSNIYDFCLRQKASKNFNYELWNLETGDIQELKQLVRYFISENGHKLMKIKNENCETNAAPLSNVHAEDDFNYQPLVTYCNKMPKEKEKLLQQVDYHWYIDQAYKVIDKIEGRKFKTRRPQKTIQTTLF